jgi:hypothetical protein
VACGVAGALWLHQVFLDIDPPRWQFFDRAMFFAAVAYSFMQLAAGLRVQWRRSAGMLLGSSDAPIRLAWGRTAPAITSWRVAGTAVLAAIIVAQTLGHLDEHGGYLYMTRPGFPVGPGGGIDGYVYWLEGHATYEESWQFAVQTALYAGATSDHTTGDHDARAAYSYQAALLADPLGYFAGFTLLNIVWWLVAAIATWYLAAQLLGRGPPAYAAALLTAAGQGFVFMTGTPMSYVAGYAWGAVLLAVAVRWNLFGWQSDGRRWLAWGWLCGVAGLFYFTHVVLIGTAWLFGLRRVPIRHLVATSAVAFAIPGTWYAVGHYAAGLHFQETTGQDLAASARDLAQLALRSPLSLPGAAGDHTSLALVGGYYWLLVAALLGIVVAAPRRRAWYLAVALCGLGPVFVLHMIPVTQRYGYLSYPGVHIAAAEGAWFAGMTLWRGVRRIAPAFAPGTSVAWGTATLGLLVAVQLVQANVDLLGVYRYSLAFGAP